MEFSLHRGLYEDVRLERVSWEMESDVPDDPREDALRTWDGERKPPVL